MTEPSTTIVQLVLINETGDSYYRMRYPAAELAEQRPSWRVINLDAAAKERFTWALEADLLVLYQSNDTDLIPVLRERTRRGKKTLVEYNDNFYACPEWGPVAQEWRSPLLWQCYERFMREADGVLVTGPGLAELFTPLVPSDRIHILENHLHQPPPSLTKLNKSTNGELAIGWGGSLGHIADLLAVLPSIEEVLRGEPQARFHVMGNESIPSFVHLPPEQFRFTNWGTLAQYYDFWKPVQIGIAPLLDTPYNRCRSDVKAIEMVSMGTLPLLPDLLPYREFLTQTDLTPYRNFAELQERLRFYLHNRTALTEDLVRAYEYVQRTRVGPLRTERAQLYERMLPSTLSTYSWPLSIGYHEYKGATDSVPRCKQLLDQVQQLINQKQVAAARARLEAEITSYPGNPDILLALIKCLTAEGNLTAGALLAQARAEFPRDLRFVLFEISRERNQTRKVELWQALTSRLATEPPAVRDFFCGEIVRHALRQVATSPAALTVLEGLLALYPGNAPLHFGLAEALVRQGRESEARAHFEAVSRLYTELLQNRELPSLTQPGYVRAWIETLQARGTNKIS